ncbi:hypothetical protein [Shimia thalassica]|uniref:hypothetical protein n=1 Tax=Shimia thalassica TaxID=1715693 RepID=UPI0026E27783|nr:hypothetical protein [Shimia thalassica]MDO6484075.1 hypothetical protein [Shimia thalassica]
MLAVLFCLTNSMLLFSTAYAEEESFLEREDRYTRENPSHDSLIQWTEPVRLEILGAASADDMFFAASTISSVAELSLTYASLVGESSTWFTEKSLFSPKANYIVVFLPDIENKEAFDKADLQARGLDVSAAHPSVRDIVDNGISRLGAGCYGAWQASQKNEVSGFVIVADPNHDPKGCVKSVSISSFGVYPVVRIIEFPDKLPLPLVSESHLLLLISGYCRKILKDNSFHCPARLLASLDAVEAED